MCAGVSTHMHIYMYADTDTDTDTEAHSTTRALLKLVCKENYFLGDPHLLDKNNVVYSDLFSVFMAYTLSCGWVGLPRFPLLFEFWKYGDDNGHF